MKVALFATCLADMFRPNVGKATVELLEHLGVETEFPDSQVCCGQPAYNTGYVKETKKAAKNMIRAFEKAEYVVTPSGSCAAMFQEYPDLFRDDPKWHDPAKELADKTYELTQFIIDVLNITDVGARLEGKATYHTSCHMMRLLGVKDAPFTLLSHVRGLEVEPLPNSQNCCGFGGTFSVKMPRISEQMVDEKVDNVLKTGADYLIGADSGCLLNIGGRLERLGKKVKVMHIAEVLNCRQGGNYHGFENQ
ncbi:(Fe-S)-binding protein [Thermoactinomyces mirandus]|uniref:Lactate utilization protein A n=1 Tax=Thermoactinomyces mirandus TaxID=2756294 RepID=A0A7W1XRW2_9BACL|nr:(Fe-S)-binding protein [Thermoactinomyces mirandus]MBA4602144.1 (Fe-S)-binding protein [Thermoactinomyces mirandus]